MNRADRRQPWAGLGLVVGLIISAALLGVAPRFMPDSYDWIAHTTSESAAQGVGAAWIARMGFTLFGISVFSLSLMARDVWSRWARFSHLAFGLFMMMAAAASSRPWFEPATYSQTEDWVHSAAATAMGFAFAAGVVLVSLGRGRVGLRIGILDALAVVASVAIPLGMVAIPEAAGLLQRVMFLLAYLWYVAACLLGSDRPRHKVDAGFGQETNTNSAEV